MTGLEIASLRQLAVRVVTRHAGSDADAAAVAAAAHRAYDDLGRVLAPLIGQIGIDALTARAVHLAQREYPWLAKMRDPEHATEPMTHACMSLERHTAALAIEAAGAVLATFTGLLVTMIGEPLTTRLMRQAWPDGFSGAGTEETRA